jgi:beta-xylosidase
MNNPASPLALTLDPDPAIGRLWISDQGDGTYRNPVLCADYSDPDVIRVGDDFYLTASSFNCTPGLPILHSTDLVNWTIIGHAVKNLPHPRYAEVQHGCGIWAPAIRFHAGKFWIFFPMPDEGIYLVTADDPAGKWSEPHLVQAGKGLIDPCPLWDDDGQAYLVHAYAGSRAGFKHRLRICPMAPDGSRLLGEGKIVFHNPEKHPTLEGPKFLKKDGWYYILAPAGGVEHGWQVALRSRHIYGPYEDKIVLEQGDTSTNGPHQGALVDTAGGEWWFVHFQDAGIHGRIVHLQPVKWDDGWPLMGNGGRPVPHFQKPAVGRDSAVKVPQSSDEFDSSRIGLQWQWHANHPDNWASLAARKGWLRLFCVPMPAGAVNLWNAPNLLLQKLPAIQCSVAARLDFNGLAPGNKAGLIMMGQNYSYLAVERTGNGFRLIKASCHNASASHPETIESEVHCHGNLIQLRIEVDGNGQCDFSHAQDDGPFVPAGKSFQATKGLWIGAKVGLFATAPADVQSQGWSDFDYLRLME